LRQASLLAVTSQLPWPLDSGGHLRTFHLLRALAGHFRVRLVAGVPPGQEGGTQAVRDAGITVMPAHLPERQPWREGLRMAKAVAAGEPYVFYRRHDRRAVRSALIAAIAGEAPDILYLDHLDSMLFSSLAGRSRIVADLHNVYSLLAQRTAAEHRSTIASWYLKRESRLLDRLERRTARDADLVMTVSDTEAAHFQSLGARRTCVVPNGVDCRYYESLPLGRETPRAPIVLFVGGLSWAPNVTAVQFLANVVLPNLRARYPDAIVRIVGRGQPDTMAALAAIPGVEVTGSVPDVRPHLGEASVVAVPLEAGGGTRLKILEAFAAGLPVVSTAVGCEGIAAEHGRQLIVADRGDFAGAIAGLLADPAWGRRLAAEARELVRRVYDWGVVGNQAAAAVADVV
jgi:glycosyltransferase involved in cell wall biosynthesis